MPRHYFEITARFGPAELFQALRIVVEDGRHRPLKPEFEFDWLKRRVEISANSRCGVEDLLEILLVRVQKHGKGLLLPGDTQEREGGRFAIPIGVLVQTPDVYVELLAAALADFGITNLRREFDGNGLSIGLGVATSALPYKAMVEEFPLPDYLGVVDHGVKE